MSLPLENARTGVKYPRVPLIAISKESSRGRPRVSQPQSRHLLEKQSEIARSKRPELKRRNPQPIRRGGHQGEQLSASAQQDGESDSHKPVLTQEEERRQRQDSGS